METQNLSEAEGNYSGVTPDERLAMSRIFDCKEGISLVLEQFPDVLVSGEPIK